MSVEAGGPAMVLRDELEEKLRSAGMMFPRHNLLVGVIINTMGLLAVSGEQARFGGTTIVKNVLVVSQEVMLLSSVLGINVQFRFKNILEVPLSILVDGNIIGFELPTLYFMNKKVPDEELQRAQVLFNFLQLVRHYTAELGAQRVAELVHDFNNIAGTDPLPDRPRRSQQIRTTGTGVRLVGLEVLPGQVPLATRNLNAGSSQDAGVENLSCDLTGGLKQRAYRSPDENTPPAPVQALTRDRRKREGGFF